MIDNEIKIVVDSAADMLTLDGIDFASAPLKIITTEKEYIDNENLDVEVMVNDLLAYKGKSSTSCPNCEEWLQAFGDAKKIFCITITGTLSGSYNAACIAKQTYEEQYPDRKVCVINSLTTGPEMRLIVEKIQELINEEKTYEEICTLISEEMKDMGLFFMLESMRNLANNGRVNPIVAKIAGFLGIRVVGKASSKGDLQQLDKCRGEKKALEAIISHLKELGGKLKKIIIAHCLNESAALTLKERIIQEFEKIRVEICKCRGLCSFYAEKGGLLVGYEKAKA